MGLRQLELPRCADQQVFRTIDPKDGDFDRFGRLVEFPEQLFTCIVIESGRLRVFNDAIEGPHVSHRSGL
jgi:hypothetical protein